MAQQQILTSEEDLGSIISRIEERLRCIPLLLYELDAPEICPEEIALLCGKEDQPHVVDELAGSMDFYITEPKKIPHRIQGFALSEIQFNATCRHREDWEDWWLIIDPVKKIFYWVDECRKCSAKVQEILLADMGFEEISESQAEEEYEAKDG